MTIFLILAPYGAFAVLMLLASSTVSLVAASAVCLATIAVDALRGRSLKILPVGSAILFAGIAGYLAVIDPGVSDKAVKLAVDIGIFAISVGSMLIRHPFTMQYALESVPAEIAAMPGFSRANYVITGVWTVATLLMMLANAADSLCAGPADLARAGGGVRRAQQRDLVHEMVFGLSPR